MNAQNDWKTFFGFALRVIVAHMATYFVFGIIMSNVFDYGEVFKREVIRDYMLPMDEHNIVLGPLMQPIRGLIFAIGLWPLRSLLIEKKRGWLILWGLLVTIGILSTPAASPGSIEGMLYSKLPMWYHLMGYPEIVLQTLVFSIWLVWWEKQSLRSHGTEIRKEDSLFAEIVKAVMTACFAYIGYALGGILMALVANARATATGTGGVDFAAAGADFKMQFMFVVAFIVNIGAVFRVARRWQANQITLRGVFLLFWFIDALVPWLYQTFVLGGSFIPTAILLGLFPAAIIALSIRMNYRRTAIQESR
ncbi:MAG: hypothetical protein L6Q49_10775 [Anaerolineales bacterium]|nr:hypothetical protein [Anaerolineales bacterium]